MLSRTACGQWRSSSLKALLLVVIVECFRRFQQDNLALLPHTYRFAGSTFPDIQRRALRSYVSCAKPRTLSVNRRNAVTECGAEMEAKAQIAVFADGESFGPNELAAICEALDSYGVVTDPKIWLTEGRLSLDGWAQQLKEQGFSATVLDDGPDIANRRRLILSAVEEFVSSEFVSTTHFSASTSTSNPQTARWTISTTM